MDTSAYDAKTRHLPRILCLHGGGTNAAIFRTQCRQVSRSLEPHFRLVYVEAPYASLPGPDVVPVYADCGPFKRWFPDGEGYSDADVIRAIDASVREAMQNDDARIGSPGPWVGLLGFSQGAKLAASLLYRQQQRAARHPERVGLSENWRFGVLLAGRAPIVALDLEVCRSAMLDRPASARVAEGDRPVSSSGDPAGDEHLLRLPTLHVHGTLDPGLELHRQLLDRYCASGTTRLLEWPGNHRVPIKSADVDPLVDEMLKMAASTGVAV
ncbi:uncharacterized protein PpBr36_09634 [Pyricularia pennisetigena]|uniref:uncharacterized protein n=1 Tax=Pyricularia pennisetigena TaxID=1578925 RepID=UPI00114FDD4D|nr:uncharacterized protein PpBr36_09634 [Pyricularia pennisetigena]TLS21865.1 hypothetical protein PpBr36_09634 [Pyricularia pennisetigena]